jgi:hypothetical protein
MKLSVRRMVLLFLCLILSFLSAHIMTWATSVIVPSDDEMIIGAPEFAVGENVLLFWTHGPTAACAFTTGSSASSTSG